MIQYIAVADAKVSLDGPKAFVASAKNQAGNACIHKSAGAHRAGLEGRVDRAAVKAVIFDRLARRTKCNDLRVSRRIVSADGLVIAGGDDLVAGVDYHGTNR